MSGRTGRWAAALLILASGVVAAASDREIPLSSDGGIGFDDMIFAPALRRVVVPAGRMGTVFLLDPKGGRPTALPGFTVST